MSSNISNQSGLPLVCNGLQFQEYAPTTVVVINVIMVLMLNSITAVIATFANGLILVMVLWEASLRTPTVLLFSRLALTDLLIGIVLIPTYNVVHYYRMKGVYLCTLQIANAYFINLLAFCSGTGIAVISADRFIAVIFPLTYRKPKYHRRIRRLLATIWIIWLVFLVFPFVRVIEADKLDAINAAVIVTYFIIVCFCYATAIHSIRRLSSVGNSKNATISKNDIEARVKAARMRKILATASLVTFAFFLAYIPRLIRSILLKTTGHGLINSYVLGCWSTSAIFISSAVNPLIYLWKLKSVRSAMIDTFVKIRRVCND